MGQYVLTYNMLQDLACDTGNGDWSVVARFMHAPLLVDWSDESLRPFLGHCALLQRLVEQGREYGGQFVG